MKQRIGDRYEFDRATDIIGKGGMGTVYVGLDTSTGQKVAIKQLKPDIIEENPDFVERFNREAEALRRLNHPNIVTVFDTIADDDAHYLIMEYVAGGSLWDEMEKTKQLPLARVLQIALDLSDALTRAHRLKIIHRDLKPANILIAEDGTPRLTDFGVAQLGDKTRVTRTGAVVGTLNYLSPEALNGDPIDERTDIWAFGVMLYEMLAGHNPFPEESATALVTAILTKPIADISSSRPDVPPSMVHLLEQMLTKDRKQRIDSIRKVGSELEDIIRYADSDDDLAIAIKPELLNQHTGRFDTPTPNSTTPNSLHSTLAKPSPSKPMMTVMKSDTGEEYVVMPKRYANRVRLLFLIMPLAIIGIIVFIATRPRADGGDTNITIVRPERGGGDGVIVMDDTLMPIMPTAEEVPEGYYPVAVLPGTSPDEDNPEIQMEIVEGLRQALQTDIPFSNIRVVNESARMQMVEADVNSALPIMTINTEISSQAGLIILPEEREDGLHVFIQLGDLARFPYNTFERTLLERLINVELVVESPSDIAPYVVGALAILHSAGGDMFEFMRTMTILSQLPASTATMVSAGTSASVHGYFANFINDADVALEFINTALERDGGNAMLFMYRSLINVRQFNFDSAASDIISAQRLGPDTWTLPMYAIATFSGEDVIDVLNQILTIRPDDWFAYFMIGNNYYNQNDLESARVALDNALTRNPQMNVVHLLSFVIALREGRLADGGRLLNELVTLFPDPNFSYRVLSATFGEVYSVTTLLHSSLANLVIGQFNRVIDDTATVLSFVSDPQSFIQDTSQLSEMMTPNPELTETPIAGLDGSNIPYFYASDLFMIRGIAFCSLGRYDEALESYSTGLGIDPTNHMLHLLRAEIFFLNGDQTSSQADIVQAMGLSDEMDAFILNATDADGDGIGAGCSNFFDVFSQMGQ